MTYELTIRIEHRDKVKVERVTCHGAEALASEKSHWKAMCPTGGTVTFSIREI
jgi:hypothetical protein